MNVVIKIKDHKRGAKPRSDKRASVRFRERYKNDSQYREHRKQLSQQYAEKNRERVKATRNAWVARNREAVRIHRSRAYQKQKLQLTQSEGFLEVNGNVSINIRRK